MFCVFGTNKLNLEHDVTHFKPEYLSPPKEKNGDD